MITRWLLIAGGTIALGVGAAGIFLPLVPTTPLLLLSAACYVRSSDKLYGWLTSHPRFGPYVHNYLAGRGIPRRAKALAIVLLWLSIGSTAWLVVPLLAVRALLFAIAAAVTVWILKMPTSDDCTPHEVPAREDDAAS